MLNSSLRCINPSSLSFTSSVTNLTYPIQTHATCSSSNLINLNCTQCDAFYVGELEIGTPRAWKGTNPPLTVPTTCPFQSKFTANLSNSLLIPVGFRTFPLTPIKSLTGILNWPTNSFYPLDTLPVLFSDNSPLSFAFSPLHILPYCLLDLHPATLKHSVTAAAPTWHVYQCQY